MDSSDFLQCVVRRLMYSSRDYWFEPRSTKYQTLQDRPGLHAVLSHIPFVLEMNPSQTSAIEALKKLK